MKKHLTHVSSRQVHICLLDRTHMSSSKEKKCENHFWPKVMTRNGMYHFHPSAKSRRELKIQTSAYYAGLSIRGSFFKAHLPITSKTPSLLQNRQFVDFQKDLFGNFFY